MIYIIKKQNKYYMYGSCNNDITYDGDAEELTFRNKHDRFRVTTEEWSRALDGMNPDASFMTIKANDDLP